MEQMGLFGAAEAAAVSAGPAGRASGAGTHSMRVMSRRGDPESSRRAAREMVATGKKEGDSLLVLHAVIAHPGLTSRELSEHIVGMDRYQVARRLPEIERRELIHRTEAEGEDLRWWPGKNCGL